MNWNKLLKGCVSVVMALTCIGVNAASKDISISIQTDKTILGENDDVALTVTMTNTSATPQYVLKWHTPFVEIEEPLFDVYRDGVKVDYLGAYYKRPAPQASDYFVLQPGKSHTRKIELSALYDMRVTGDYSIRYRTKSMHLFAAGFHANGMPALDESGEMQSNAVSLWINGQLPRGTVTTQKEPPTQQPAGLSFSSCSNSQANTIRSAISAASSMSSDSVSYLTGGKTGARYTTWFGTYTSSRYSTVKSHFNAIKDAFATKPVVVDCSCKKSYYAYVYPTQPYKIYVCNAFWSAPMTGTDSKGGTLVHEMSHFNVVASTNDWAYGQSAAKSLAISNPNNAVDNADSHEYFAENTPYLP